MPRYKSPPRRLNPIHPQWFYSRQILPLPTLKELFKEFPQAQFTMNVPMEIFLMIYEQTRVEVQKMMHYNVMRQLRRTVRRDGVWHKLAGKLKQAFHEYEEAPLMDLVSARQVDMRILKYTPSILNFEVHADLQKLYPDLVHVGVPCFVQWDTDRFNNYFVQIQNCTMRVSVEDFSDAE
jgi:hypothetical protein